MSSQSFADLGVSNAVASALADRGIESPFPVQEMVIADVLDGNDVLVQSPTGSGKTLAFGVPMVDLVSADARRPAALVLAPPASSPRRSWRSCARSPARARCPSPRSTAVSASRPQARKAAKAHIVVATPGRLEDLLQRRDITLEHVRRARARRGRPHARHGLQARRRPHRRQDPQGPPDDVLLGHARGSRRQDRVCLHPRRRPAMRTSRSTSARPTSSTGSCISRTTAS